MADTQIKAVITADDKASSTLKNFGNNVGFSFTKMAAAVATGTLALQGIEKAATGVFDLFKSSIDTTVQLGLSTLQLQRNFGLSAESASGLIAVFQRFGLDADNASRAFGIFQKKLVEVSEGSDLALKNTALLGVNLKDNNGHLRNMSDILLDVADRFKSGVVPATERAGVAMTLFGRSGQNLIPVLLQGRDGIIELEKRADSLGVVLSQDNVDAIRKNVAAQNDLKEAVAGAKLQIGNALIPEITKVIGVVMEWIKANGGIKTIMQRDVIPIIKEVIAWLNNNKQTFIDIAKAGLDFAKVLVSVFKFVAGAVYAFRVTTLDPLQTAVRVTFDFFHNKVATVINDVIQWFRALPGNISKVVSGIEAIIEAPFIAAFNTIKSGITDVVNTFNRVKNDITGAPGHAISGAAGLLHKIPGFAEGGTVPGPIGAPQLAVVHGGEYVVPNGGGKASPQVNVSFHGVFTGNQQDFRKLAIQVFQAGADVASMKNNDVSSMTSQQWRRL